MPKTYNVCFRYADAISPIGGGTKHDEDKNRLELLHPLFIDAVGQIMTHGAKKYSAWNWYKGMSWSRVYGSLQRHLNSWYDREQCDSETKKSHLWHAACCLMFLVVYEITGRGKDDRPTR